MNKNTLKGIWAVFAAFLVVFILSVGTDLALIKAGVYPTIQQMQETGFHVWWMALIALVYRSAYGVLGSYISASLAPNKPMMYAMIPGYIGFFISIAGTVVNWGKGPWWYGVLFTALILPCAWLGGKLKTK